LLAKLVREQRLGLRNMSLGFDRTPLCEKTSTIALRQQPDRGGGPAGEGGGADGDADDVAIGRRRVLFASALSFRPPS